MDRIFARIRRIIRAIAEAERQNLADGVHLLPNGPRREEINRLRVQRLAELQELLLGPAARGAEQAGWREETVTARMADLFNAANAATRWDRWGDHYEDFLAWENDLDGRAEVGEPEWAHRTWRAPSPSGNPRDDLAALLDRVETTMRPVMLLAPTATGQDQAGSPARKQPHLRRLVFDPDTLTVKLDQKPYRIDDPKAFAVYRAIALRKPDAPWITKAVIGREVRGVKGTKTIPRLIAKLPRTLRCTVLTSTKGYAIKLPELPLEKGRKGL